MNRLEGKVALITGGSSGIGLATARLFRAEGAQVIITGRDSVRLEVAQLELGGETLALRSDAGSIADIEALMGLIERRVGRLDVLVLNAAAVRPGMVAEMSVDDLQDTFAVNVQGVMFAVQKGLPILRDHASIIVTTAIASMVGCVGFSAYGASKAALRAFVRTAALELIGRGIRINAISPGPIDTPCWERPGAAADALSAARAEIEGKSPIKRFGRPEEVAKVALFLASEDASYVVGEEIVVDGGMSLL